MFKVMIDYDIPKSVILIYKNYFLYVDLNGYISSDEVDFYNCRIKFISLNLLECCYKIDLINGINNTISLRNSLNYIL